MKTEKNCYLRLFTVLLLFIFSVSLGILLESVRFHVVGYYSSTNAEVPSSIINIMSLHSNAKDFYPEYLTFVHIMLIPCLVIICLNYKKMFCPKEEVRFILTCLLGMIFNLTIAIFIILMMADPIYRLGVLPNTPRLYSLPSKTFYVILWLLFFTSIVLIGKEILTKLIKRHN